MIEDAMSVPEDLVTPGAVRFFQQVLGRLRIYHRHRVVGLQHVPRRGGALLVLHHTLATYDTFLLGLAIYENTRRLPASLGDDLIFRNPRLGPLAHRAGIRAASPTSGRELLDEGHLLAVAPGGMWECLRPSTERYQHRWHDRRGFCRLALEAGVPLVLAACPSADDIFRVRPSRLTNEAYERFKVPVPVARGLGPTLLPRPVRLTHHVAAPIHPPTFEPGQVEDQVTELHAEACAVMERLLARS